MSEQNAPEQGPAAPSPQDPYPLSEWERRSLDRIVSKLTRWRADDHHDAIVLQRGEVIMLLEGLRRGHLR